MTETPLKNAYEKFYSQGGYNDNRYLRAICRRVERHPETSKVNPNPSLYPIFGSFAKHDITFNIVYGCLPLFSAGLKHSSKKGLGDLCKQAIGGAGDRANGMEKRILRLFRIENPIMFLSRLEDIVRATNHPVVDMDQLYFDLSLMMRQDESVVIKWLRDFYHRPEPKNQKVQKATPTA